MFLTEEDRKGQNNGFAHDKELILIEQDTVCVTKMWKFLADVEPTKIEHGANFFSSKNAEGEG